MAYETNTTRRDTNRYAQPPMSTGNPFWDMMLSFGKTSQQALTGYAARAEYGTRSDRGAVQQTTSNVEVIPVGEETLNVGTRLMTGETTRVRRIVVETPVEQDVSLREERVVVERRRPTGAASSGTQGILSETAVEMSDSFEVAEVWKSVRVTEEVVLRREVTERRETVRDTVRRDEVVVDQAKRSLAAPRHEPETAQQDRKATSLTQPSKPEPAQMAADLKKVAERFETKAEQHDKVSAASRSEASAPKAEQKHAAVPSQSEHPAASKAQDDKGGQGRKG